MAAGSSAPELFTALITIFIAPGDQACILIVRSPALPTIDCALRAAPNAAWRRARVLCAQGVGTIVGSAVFNICVIVGVTALSAGQVPYASSPCLQGARSPCARGTGCRLPVTFATSPRARSPRATCSRRPCALAGCVRVGATYERAHQAQMRRACLRSARATPGASFAARSCRHPAVRGAAVQGGARAWPVPPRLRLGCAPPSSRRGLATL
eukprot:1075061-Pleurochrysis_carterae.AAC.15